MWSGPRNLSTAMMYSFGAREDFAVVDEPFYAAYLKETGLKHPLRDEILASQPSKPQDVIETLMGSIPFNRAHFYQKHMTQHMVGAVPRAWMKSVSNVFLIRHPCRVLASFDAKYEKPSLLDIGFIQQLELFEMVRATGQTPVVIDSSDIRGNPEAKLRDLCDALNISWDYKMLNWPSGGHPSDGVWASHWYASVHASTGFAGKDGPLPRLSERLQIIADEAISAYDMLRQHKL